MTDEDYYAVMHAAREAKKHGEPFTDEQALEVMFDNARQRLKEERRR